MKKFNLMDYNSDRDLSEYNLTAKQAILAYCKQCCCFQPSEVRLCPSKDCPLWKISRQYLKLIEKPNNLTDEEKLKIKNRLQEARNRIYQEKADLQK